MKPFKFFFAVATVIAVVAMFAGVEFPPKAHAFSGPLTVPANWEVTCTGTAAPIKAAGNNPIAFDCYSLSATSVFLGDSTVGISGEYCISTDDASCVSKRISMDAKPDGLYCRTAGSSITLYCLGAR